jgi:hypothetical protein
VLLRRIAATHKNKRIRLFFQDEARIGQKGRTCHIWWKRGERPPGLCDKRFTFAYIFACVEPGTDNGFALVMPYANTEAMQQFLDRFAATIADDEHVVMVLDQAGWHDSRALSVPANVTLVALPPYSPELNPVERVWLYLKERFLSHRLHDAITRLSSMPPARLGGTSPPRPAASSRFAPTPGSRRSRLRVDGMSRCCHRYRRKA